MPEIEVVIESNEISVEMPTQVVEVEIPGWITVINQTSTRITWEGEPTAELGLVLDFYLDSVSGDFYQKTTDTTRTLKGNLWAGGDSWTYTHTQSTPSTTRTMTHNLGYNPNYIAVDSIWRQFFAAPSRPDTNTMVLTLSAAISGVAYLS
jgi:hypothetical protein